jgi:hypothetical protein
MGANVRNGSKSVAAGKGGKLPSGLQLFDDLVVSRLRYAFALLAREKGAIFGEKME